MISEVPEQKQKARAAFVALVFGKALMELPENFEGGRAEKSALDRCLKWHGQICEECGSQRLPRHNGLASAARVEKFLKLVKLSPKLDAVQANVRRAAGLWAAVVLIWDLRITCPLFQKHKGWRYLELAAEQLGRALLRSYPGADLEGDRMYLELAW